MSPKSGWLLPLLLVALLPACSSMQPAASVSDAARVRLYDDRFDQLAVLSSWSIEGRLAVSNDKDGGSGNFKWKKGSATNRMDFHGALGRGAWKLHSDELGAELELADGELHRADSVDQLVRFQVGWEIPVDQLSWWVLGLAAPGAFDQRAIDEQGNLSELLQDGWVIEYGKYREFDGFSLPVRLTARQDDWKVKLAIRDWKLAEESGLHE